MSNQTRRREGSNFGRWFWHTSSLADFPHCPPRRKGVGLSSNRCRAITNDCVMMCCMKSRWNTVLWSFWSVVAVLTIIIMEIAFCLFLSIYQVPKIKKLDYDGV